MSKERTNDTCQTLSEGHEFKLDEFVDGKITVTTFLMDMSEDHSELKDAVLALAQRNIQQGKV